VLKYVLLSLLVVASMVASPTPAIAQTTSPSNDLETLAIDTDQDTDRVGLVDPATGIWHLRGVGGATNSFFYGNPGDFPIVGDWNCDGIDTPGLYRQSDGFVYLRNSNSQGIANIRFFFGNPGDIPLAGDFDGDGCDTVSIYRASEARIYVINELGANDGGLGAADFNYIFGNPGDKPFVGDFNGDGIDTVGLHRESTGFVYFRNSHTQGVANAEFFFGDPGDRLVAGDWGVVNGVDTPAVFRPSNTTFYFRYTNTQGNANESITMGQASYLPVAGTWAQPGPPPPPPPPPPAPTIGGTLPLGLINSPYSATLTKSGGQPPLTVTKISGNATWANVSASGVVTGTPPATGNFTLGVRVTDALGRTATANLPLQVVNGCEGTGTLPLAQCQALVDLYRSTNGHNWTEATGWLTGNPCTVPWHGVACDVTNMNVTEIALDENNLTGTISSLSVFTGLIELDLSNNAIGETLPDISALTALTTIDLGENLLTGVDSSVWEAPTLAHLDLSDNSLSGTIPADINLPVLVTLNLSNSGLGGGIPVDLWNSINLTDIDLSENTFNGGIDTAIGGLVSLTDLDLSDNALEGVIPDQFLNLRPVPEGGSLINLSLTSNGCFETANLDLQGFLTGLDPEWNDGCV
jgi:hypothetical protein